MKRFCLLRHFGSELNRLSSLGAQEKETLPDNCCCRAHESGHLSQQQQQPERATEAMNMDLANRTSRQCNCGFNKRNLKPVHGTQMSSKQKRQQAHKRQPSRRTTEAATLRCQAVAEAPQASEQGEICTPSHPRLLNFLDNSIDCHASARHYVLFEQSLTESMVSNLRNLTCLIAANKTSVAMYTCGKKSFTQHYNGIQIMSTI